MTETLVENLYVVKNKQGTVDTEIAPVPPEGAVRISLLTNLDLDSSELTFNYIQSDN